MNNQRRGSLSSISGLTPLVPLGSRPTSPNAQSSHSAGAHGAPKPSSSLANNQNRPKSSTVTRETLMELKKSKKGAPSVDGSIASRSDTSSVVMDSVNDLDRYITTTKKMSETLRLNEMIANPTPETLEAFSRRFSALFLILDAQTRMSKYPFIVMAPDCTVLMVSPSIVELSKFAADEMRGNNINVLMEESLAVIHDSIVYNYCQRIIRGEDDHSSVVNNTRPVKLRQRDGTMIPVEISVKVIFSDADGNIGDGDEHAANASTVNRSSRQAMLFIGQLRDVRNEVRLRNMVEDSVLLRDLFPFPYIEATETMSITRFNPAAAQAFGLSAERAIGKNVTVLMPRYIYRVNGRRFKREQHDMVVSTYVSKVRAVGKANVHSAIVDNKTNHMASRLNTKDPRSITEETFPMELEVRMQLSQEGEIRFQAFARDCENFMNAREAEQALIRQTFPLPIAEEIIKGEDVNGERDIAVVFCDIVGFTQLSSMMEDSKAMTILNDLFSKFSTVKQVIPSFDPIKTNYDEFMAVTGLDKHSDRNANNHTDDAVRAALLMLQHLEQYNEVTCSNVEIRIGIDSGPCMCGIIGSAGQKSFDIIGQTSVKASRAENTGKPNQIHITEACYNRLSNESGLKDKFSPAGRVMFKNMGEEVTYITGRT